MTTLDGLAEQFEAHRPHLRSVAYRMLGSLSEAEDAAQEAWLRLSRSDVSDVANLRGWLTTVVARVCLDMLRTRSSRREGVLDTHVPDPIVTRALVVDGDGPEAATIRAEAVGLALLVVLDTLAPAERLVFVLHDVFGMPFEQIAPIVGRSVDAARQVASRARRRVRSRAPVADPDLRAHRRAVEAFLSAVQDGDVAALMTVLDPDVVLRADGGAMSGLSRVVRGAQAVVDQAAMFSTMALTIQTVVVNGGLGVISRLPDGRAFSVMGFTVAAGRIVQIDILADRSRVGDLRLPEVDDPG